MESLLTDFLARLADDPGWRAGAVLDVRSAAEFAAAHLPGAVSLPLAPGEDPEAVVPSIFLPPRERPLLVVAGTVAAARALAEHLTARGRDAVSALGLPAELAGRLPPACLARGPSRAHLWQPPAWLAAHGDLLPPPAAGPVLDLGCGSGRSAVWLAERGYRVTGLDWQVEALDLGSRLAASRGVACDFRRVDLRRPGAVPAGPWSVVMDFRFLRRELLAEMATLLRPGGVAVVRTFRHVPGYRGHPHSRHRLGPAELLRCFPAGRYQILAHEEGHDPDGRPAAGIVARRRE